MKEYFNPLITTCENMKRELSYEMVEWDLLLSDKDKNEYYNAMKKLQDIIDMLEAM